MKAQELYRTLMARYYEEALKAKERGELIGWSTSGFPQEIPESMGLRVVYPENHAATLAMRGEGALFLAKADALGYSNDLCSYARINLGYIESFHAASVNIPKPDFLLCSSNTCHQLLKWFDILKCRFQIPLFYLDFPQPIKGSPDKNALAYVSAQMQRLIRDLSRWSGKSFSQVRYEKVMKTSVIVGRLWQEVNQLAAQRPSPINGFDLFVYMSALVTQRGKKETQIFLESLSEEMKEKTRRGHSDFPSEEKGRLFFEGLPCWSALYSMQLPFLKEGIDLVASPYASSFGLVYSSPEEMVKAYYAIPPSLSFEEALSLREKAIEESQPDGLAFALLRTCKIYSGFYYEMERRLSEKSGKPSLLFDGDQADEKDFSLAQYQTRLQAFSEILKEEKGCPSKKL